MEASVVARLFGVRLLRLDASVALAPAEVRPTAGPVQAAPRTTTRSAPRRATVAPGRDLPEAVRTLSEAAEVLSDTKRDGFDRN